MSPNGALSFNSYSEYENEENFKKWMQIFTTSPENVINAVFTALTNDYNFRHVNGNIADYHICLSEYMDSFIIIDFDKFFQFEYSHGGTLTMQDYHYPYSSINVKMNYHATEEEKQFDKKQKLSLINTSVINVKKLIDALNYYIERNKNNEY